MVSDSYYPVSEFQNAFPTLRALTRSVVDEIPTVNTLLQKLNNQFPTLIVVFRRLVNEIPTIITLFQMLNS